MQQLPFTRFQEIVIVVEETRSVKGWSGAVGTKTNIIYVAMN